MKIVLLTDKCVDRLLRLPIKLSQLLFHIAFQIPVSPFWSNVEQILKET